MSNTNPTRRAIDALLDAGDDIPDIDFPYPDCPVCHEPLTHDDGWFCPGCEVYWERSGAGGEYQGERAAASGETT